MTYLTTMAACDNAEPLTLETITAAIKALEKKPALPEDHPLHGVYESFECAALTGRGLIVVSGDKAYYGPDIFSFKEVKVMKVLEPLKIEEMPLSFSWEFESQPINWDYRL